jgi:hypothetical protein
LLLGLQNLFGDNRVLRLVMDHGMYGKIADTVSGRVANLACVSGHVPLCAFAGALGKFQVFTVLRRPVDRLFSQFRFLRLHPPEVLQRMGLQPDFSFAEFLAAPAPEIYSQVHNGMARVLGGSAAMWRVGTPEYERMDAHPAVLEEALRALDVMEFGLAEEMPGTFRLLSGRLGLPAPLDAPTVNATDQQASAEEESAANIEAIIRLNPFDTALYDAAASLFAARVRQAPVPWSDVPETVFVPALNHAVPVGDIPGRHGFHGWRRICLRGCARTARRASTSAGRRGRAASCCAAIAPRTAIRSRESASSSTARGSRSGWRGMRTDPGSTWRRARSTPRGTRMS